LADLAPSNTSLSLFALTWTVIHAIDEKSPLAGYDAERLEEGDARLQSAPLSITCAFTPPSRSCSKCTYAEAVTLDDQRRPVADLTRLSLGRAGPISAP
jgi:hypothetical protein